ncbi:MAG: ATPase AAA [Gammaproteobacteria bacterium]|nr:MAG: general secretion pathway protein [Pseudomonadota bacterium]MBC6945920.1 general secretion pathway protein [Gammaproteobacteria bacterium]MCE7895842.1 general secretion pathway protein [Gammaproteobacteria bacterium PRO8]MDL1881762.1 general secretion pathway protein [Gammaproteobacteria bacterium PRO2]MCL4776385.1 AAA family ATPase [Gammaproteobacteria bacterium]
MYENFYGLRERPFALLPDPSFLYMSKRHATALTLLQYSIQNRQGFTVITGEVGCGKTTLINRLLDEVGPELRVGLINFTHNNFGEMAEWIMMAYGLEYKGKTQVELYDDFVQFLIREYAAGHPVVLIVDEAQNLGVKGLEEVRMLSNVNAQKDYLLHLILVGQPELHDLLKKHELRQLTQRVSVAYNLEPFSFGDVAAYIAHRMKVAGGDPAVFAPEAVRLIAAASDGIPRLVNTLCDLCLVYGFSAERARIDGATVRSVLRDRVRMGLPVGRGRGRSGLGNSPKAESI